MVKKMFGKSSGKPRVSTLGFKKDAEAWCCIPKFKPGVTKKDAKSVFF
jgi:hypothetical protein